MGRTKELSESDLKRATLEAIKAARRLMALHEPDPLLAGAHKVMRRRLSQLERMLQDRRRKPLFSAMLHSIGREVAKVVSDLVQPLIRYLSPSPVG